MIIPDKEYERMRSGTKSAWDILQTAPRLDEDDLPLVRDRTPMRAIDLT